MVLDNFFLGICMGQATEVFKCLYLYVTHYMCMRVCVHVHKHACVGACVYAYMCACS